VTLAEEKFNQARQKHDLHERNENPAPEYFQHPKRSIVKRSR
jgi:hypothetical protein